MPPTTLLCLGVIATTANPLVAMAQSAITLFAEGGRADHPTLPYTGKWVSATEVVVGTDEQGSMWQLGCKLSVCDSCDATFTTGAVFRSIRQVNDVLVHCWEQTTTWTYSYDYYGKVTSDLYFLAIPFSGSLRAGKRDIFDVGVELNLTLGGSGREHGEIHRTTSTEKVDRDYYPAKLGAISPGYVVGYQHLFADRFVVCASARYTMIFLPEHYPISGFSATIGIGWRFRYTPYVPV